MPLRWNPIYSKFDLTGTPGGSTPVVALISDAGTANPNARNEITISGGDGITTSAVGSNLTIAVDSPLSSAYGGTGIATVTNHALIVGSGGATMSEIAPSATVGAALVSQGAGADPAYGTVAVSSGGTGQTTFTDGEIVIGTSVGNTLVKTTMTAGTGVSITNGPGSITIAASTAVATSYPTNAGTATPAGNVLNVYGGVGTQTRASGNTVQVDVTGGGLRWIDVTSTPTTLTPNAGHYINVAAGLATIPLPANGSVDPTDIMKVVGISAGGWIITQTEATHQVINGVLTSTAGVGGSTESNAATDCVTLKYLGSGVWKVIDSHGNIGTT